LGLGVKVLVRDRLGVIAPVAATAAPPLVTAAVPRELRIDPCEKKTKGNECARWREGAPTGRWCHGHGVSISTYYSGNGGAKFSKKIWVLFFFVRRISLLIFFSKDCWR